MFAAKLQNFLVFFGEEDIIYFAFSYYAESDIMHLSTHTQVVVTLHGEMRTQQD